MKTTCEKPSMLFICNEFCYPTQTGSHVRISNLIKQYSRKYSVQLLVPKFISRDYKQLQLFYDKYVTKVNIVEDNSQSIESHKGLLNYLVGPRTISDFNDVPYISSIKNIISTERFEVIHLERWFMTNIVKSDLKKNAWADYYILDFDASDYTFRKQLVKLFNGSIWGKIKCSVEPWRVRLWESRYLYKFDAVFVSSQKELEELKVRTCNNNLLLVSNGYDLPEANCKESFSNSNIILFVGTLNYFPNEQGFDYFINMVWPLISASNPNALLWHVGTCSQEIIEKYSSKKGVHFKGFVDDLSEVYGDATIVVVPLFQGNGTRIKILEAASYGKPIVATEFAAEDLAFSDNINIVYANDTIEMANKCIQLFKDLNMRATLGANAKKHIAENFSWSKIGKDIFKGLERLLPSFVI